jgi:hypothetical protein
MPPAASSGCYRALVDWVKQLKREVLALYYAVQDPRVGCMPRALALIAVGCANGPPISRLVDPAVRVRTPPHPT